MDNLWLFMVNNGYIMVYVMVYKNGLYNGLYSEWWLIIPSGLMINIPIEDGHSNSGFMGFDGIWYLHITMDFSGDQHGIFLGLTWWMGLVTLEYDGITIW